MRYRVEFLRESTEEDSVCFSRAARTAHLALAEMQAEAWAADAHRLYGARGFQIRDLQANRIVSLSTFETAPPPIN